MSGFFPSPLSSCPNPTLDPSPSVPSFLSWSSPSPISPISPSVSSLDSDSDSLAMAWVDALKVWESVRDRPHIDRARRAAVIKFRRLVPLGIPPEFRAVVWQKLLSADKLERHGLLLTLLSRPELPIYDQINKDIGRTYPNHVLFKDPSSPGQVQLANVLKAYAQYNPDVGYTQGMNFITGLLLLHMPPDEALCTLIALMTTHQFPHHSHDLSHLHAACALMDRILIKFIPKISQYLTTNDVTSVLYLPRWWMSGFEICPWGCRVRAWDCVVVEGFTGFCRVSLAILDCIQDELFKTHPSEILDTLLHPMSRDLLPDRFARAYIQFNGVNATLISKEHSRIYKETGMSAGLPPVASLNSLASSVDLASIASTIIKGNSIPISNTKDIVTTEEEESGSPPSLGPGPGPGLVARWLGTWSNS